jgi:inorganic pyrophosphatase
MKGISSLVPFAESGDLNVIIETPKGSRNKYTWDEELGLFKLTGILTAGHSFPYDFGFIPGTKGEDGDPLDVLVLMDEPAFPGCYVQARLIGSIQADQTEHNDDVERNDRLIAVASESKTTKHIRSIDDLDETLLHEIEHFFISYNDSRGKKFEPKGRADAEKARKSIEKSMTANG